LVKRLCRKARSAAGAIPDVLMARYDVFKTAADGFVVDCQADFLDHLRTRFVVPLLPPEIEPKIADRLNPVFAIDGSNYVLFPQFAAAVPVQDLKQQITSLDHEHTRIMDALDMLMIGY
jgi:toxin CcdB